MRNGFVSESLPEELLKKNLIGVGSNLALSTWEMWQDGRDRLLQFFPDHKQFIEIIEAEG